MQSKLTIPMVLLAALLAGTAAAATKPRILMWDEMIPEEAMEPPELLPGADPFAETAEPDPYASSWAFAVVDELDGQLVRIPGFVVPLESDEGGVLEEFLLVPYYGACIHVPPPPPNQIVYVRLTEPREIRKIWEPVWITGTMHTKRWTSDIAEAHYQMDGTGIEKYEE